MTRDDQFRLAARRLRVARVIRREKRDAGAQHVLHSRATVRNVMQAPPPTA